MGPCLRRDDSGVFVRLPPPTSRKTRRKIDLLPQSPGRSVLQRQFAAVTFDNLLGDRQPEAGTRATLAPRRINPEKRFEYPRHALVGNAGPFIVDGDRRGRVVFQTYSDKSATAMRCCIDHEISDSPRQRQWSR